MKAKSGYEVLLGWFVWLFWRTSHVLCTAVASNKSGTVRWQCLTCIYLGSAILKITKAPRAIIKHPQPGTNRFFRFQTGCAPRCWRVSSNRRGSRLAQAKPSEPPLWTSATKAVGAELWCRSLRHIPERVGPARSSMAPQLSTLPDVLAGQEGAPAIYVGGCGPEFTRGELNALIVQFAETLRRWGGRCRGWQTALTCHGLLANRPAP